MRDAVEGTTAFLEKRAPRFVDRGRGPEDIALDAGIAH
jgi:hypothetical protein